MWVSEDTKKEFERIKRIMEEKEKRNIPMVDVTDRVSKILKKINI